MEKKIGIVGAIVAIVVSVISVPSMIGDWIPEPVGKLDETFDAVFSNGSLHEWEHPVDILNEAHRVLKTKGKFFISDLKRNLNPLIYWSMQKMTKPKEILPGFKTSVRAAYTKAEAYELLKKSLFKTFHVKQNLFGLQLTGTKEV